MITIRISGAEPSLKYTDELFRVLIRGVQSASCRGMRRGASQKSETECGAAPGVFTVSMASRLLPSWLCLPSAGLFV